MTEYQQRAWMRTVCSQREGDYDRPFHHFGPNEIKQQLQEGLPLKFWQTFMIPGGSCYPTVLHVPLTLAVP